MPVCRLLSYATLSIPLSPCHALPSCLLPGPLHNQQRADPHTLPIRCGLFAAALSDQKDFNSTNIQEYREEYFPYPIWRAPDMHQLLVDVALCGAQAFNQSQRPSRMSYNVLLRIDIALTQHGDTVSPCFLTQGCYTVQCLQNILTIATCADALKHVCSSSLRSAEDESSCVASSEPSHVLMS